MFSTWPTKSQVEQEKGPARPPCPYALGSCHAGGAARLVLLRGAACDLSTQSCAACGASRMDGLCAGRTRRSVRAARPRPARSSALPVLARRATLACIPCVLGAFPYARVCCDGVLERNALAVGLYVRIAYAAFLLQNGAEYVAAHTLGLLEFALESYVAPAWKTYTSLHVLGLLLTVYGQVLRSLAMVHASTNFTHALAHTKSHDHVLVTTGVYAYVLPL